MNEVDGVLIRATKNKIRENCWCVSYALGIPGEQTAYVHFHVGGDHEENVRLRSFQILKADGTIVETPSRFCFAE